VKRWCSCAGMFSSGRRVYCIMLKRKQGLFVPSRSREVFYAASPQRGKRIGGVRSHPLPDQAARLISTVEMYALHLPPFGPIVTSFAFLLECAPPLS